MLPNVLCVTSATVRRSVNGVTVRRVGAKVNGATARLVGAKATSTTARPRPNHHVVSGKWVQIPHAQLVTSATVRRRSVNGVTARRASPVISQIPVLLPVVPVRIMVPPVHLVGAKVNGVTARRVGAKVNGVTARRVGAKVNGVTARRASGMAKASLLRGLRMISGTGQPRRTMFPYVTPATARRASGMGRGVLPSVRICLGVRRKK
ncbi:MAG: hypothetical protein II943_08005 [Victivallales bacterium]|nr:hypothetical protein [Victivallales bacterium]